MDTAAAAARRSANYMPSIWKHDFIQSLHSQYREEKYIQQAEELKEQVRVLLDNTNDPIDQIELLDVLQRLGISYHFKDHEQRILKNIDSLINGQELHALFKDNLHAMALGFRLLRQQAYRIDSEVFKIFMDDEGNFKTSICDDVKGLLSLYEASYLFMEGESILDAAQAFATHHLKIKLNQNMDRNLAMQISRALEVPLHWSVMRLESRRFIDVYEKEKDMKHVLLELAKLDFNILQTMYQDELKELSRWYTKTGLSEKLRFFRDRLVECFLWTLGFTYEPHLKYCRIMSAKYAILVTIIDDIYDVYGTLDELESFTEALERWDINGLEKLPDYMKICFLALFNTVNEMGYEVLKDQGFNTIPYSAKMWLENCKTYMVEARWYSSGYKPSLSEFLSNGWVSSTGPMIIGEAYLCITSPLEETPLENLQKYPEVIKWPSLVCRLADDLGTSTDELKRGDNPKSIQCYMHDTGCSEEDSRAYIKNLIASTWKKINKDVLMNLEHSREFITTSINFARISQCMYQYGDGHGIPAESKKRIMTLVIEPIPLA